jgi:3-hydroxyacyl-CoA dehydrogenase
VLVTALRSAAVLGAGTMGAQIAAHLSNAGVPVLLLDLTADAARQGLARAKALNPPPFFTPAAHALVTTGGFDEGLPALATVDWIIEAVVERLEVKQELLSRVEGHTAPGAVITSNTSGIPLSDIASGRSAPFRSRWLGTHFFNPPRYLHLVELIPTADTSAGVLDVVSRWLDRRLGKGVVIANDTPGFIANRIGLLGAALTLAALAGGDYTIEEIDAATGPAIGRPKSATFRTLDIAGLDVALNVLADLHARLEPPEESARFEPPPLLRTLVERGRTGAKAGQGFYRKSGDEILTLDPGTMDYRPRRAVRLPSVDAARQIESTPDRIRTIFLANDAAGRLLRDTLGRVLLYAARVTPEIAHSIDDVDRAMRWGFGWELGPFETWDAIGLQAVLDACGETDPPPLVREALTRGAFRPAPATRSEGRPPVRVPPAAEDFEILRAARERGAVVAGNAACSLIDIGDDVLAIEFHSKMNTIGGDTIAMIEDGIARAGASWKAVVIGNEGENFSAGANLLLLLLEAQEGNWDEVDLMVRAFQHATSVIKYSDVPAVAAPSGLSLGGGCEICLHADRVVAAAETYIGLVEAGVGLIPAGGGTKEMLVRAMAGCPASEDPLPRVQAAFETIGFGKVSTSGPDARRLGYLRAVDGSTMNRQRLISEAKLTALDRSTDYAKPQPPLAIPVGGESLRAALDLGVHLAWRAGRISDHDAVVGRKLAWVLSGGNMPHAGTLTEQQVLDLEREAFLSLCGERRTQERIAYTLKSGKPLRN